jgi:hypothetical protein
MTLDARADLAALLGVPCAQFMAAPPAPAPPAPAPAAVAVPAPALRAMVAELERVCADADADASVRGTAAFWKVWARFLLDARGAEGAPPHLASAFLADLATAFVQFWAGYRPLGAGVRPVSQQRCQRRMAAVGAAAGDARLCASVEAFLEAAAMRR